MRKAARILAIVLIGVASLFGLNEFMSDPFAGDSGLQQSVSFGTALYGVLGVLGTVGMIRRRPWSVAVAAAWAIAVTYVASVASFAFHDPRWQQPDTWKGVAAAGVSCALIGWFIVWAARQSVGPRTTPTAAT